MLGQYAALAVSVAAIATFALVTPASAQERGVRIAGFGAKSGALRSFGLNSEAALKAAADEINKAGGVMLGDGGKAQFVVNFFDDRCNAEEGISLVRRVASSHALVAVGPTCSNVAESLFGILQKRVGDASDSGLQFPILTDVAAKGGLAKISEWAFRNVPSEFEMYKSLFAWLKTKHPDLKSIYGGVEKDFAHSNATYNVMKDQAAANGFQVLGTAEWLLNDTTYSAQVRDMRRANADIVAISAHPFTTCGVLKEMKRQSVRPKLLIGLTSSSSLETLQGCAAEAEGIIIPTSFAPVNPKAKAAAEATARFNGSLDLHSGAAYEIVHILKQVIESERVMGRADTVQADRRRVRDGLARLQETDGLLGNIRRTPDREAIKPVLFVSAKSGAWTALDTPGAPAQTAPTPVPPPVVALPSAPTREQRPVPSVVPPTAVLPPPPTIAPQALPSAPGATLAPGRRVALVVGNDAYDNLPKLQKAVNDARAIETVLNGLGFEVIRVENAARRTMNQRLLDFTTRIGRGDTAFFFFAGHGVEIRGANYLLPTDTPTAREGQESLIVAEGIAADGIVAQLQERGARVSLLVLDACRENPFVRTGTRGVGATRGLGQTVAPEGVFLLYSAGYGQAALDRLSDQDPHPNSIFTRTFIARLGEQGKTLQDIAKTTQSEVRRIALTVNHQQMPAIYDQIDGLLVLSPK